MRCFTDEEIRRGCDGVIASWNRCAVCDGANEDEHDALPHPFQPLDVLDLFLKAARSDDREMPHGESEAPSHD